MTECKRCGDCCRFVTVLVDRISPEQRDYFTAHGFTIGKKGHAVSIPTMCAHLKETGEFTGKTRCDIYETRPEICRRGRCLHGTE
jgi:Fe-S-cluster containining protein